jgi:release factor glutamine methyltransferase
VPVPVPDATVALLRAAGCVFAEEEAALLRAAATDAADLERLVGRRCAGEPLEQVVGWAELAGTRVAVAPGVFVPRRRTSLLVRLGAGAVAGAAAEPPVLVDLCCGTGAVAMGVMKATDRRVDAFAADVDPVATACAADNLAGLAEVHTGDLWAALPARLRGRVDVATCNAPYVPTAEIATMPPEARDHEPRHALDGGTDGVAVHRRVASGAPAWLASGGRLLVETGRDQAGRTAEACSAAGLAVAVETDDEVGGTVVVATAP